MDPRRVRAPSCHCPKVVHRNYLKPATFKFVEKGDAMNAHGPVLAGSYSYHLVALSVIIAILAAYAALDLGGRITAAKGFIRAVWLGCGAFAMGLGIWSMHYIGMLAFQLPVSVKYDWPQVLLSPLAAILASGIALFIVSRQKMGLIAACIEAFSWEGVSLPCTTSAWRPCAYLPCACTTPRS